MPQLLRNNAVDGVSEGLDAYIRRADRNAQQREAALGRFERANIARANLLKSMYLDPESAAMSNKMLEDPVTKKTTSVKDYLLGSADQGVQQFIESQYMDEADDGSVSVKGAGTIYNLDNPYEVTDNSRGKQRKSQTQELVTY